MDPLGASSTNIHLFRVCLCLWSFLEKHLEQKLRLWIPLIWNGTVWYTPHCCWIFYRAKWSTWCFLTFCYVCNMGSTSNIWIYWCDTWLQSFRKTSTVFFPIFLPTSIVRGLRFPWDPNQISPGNFFPWAQTKARTTETILRIDLEVFLTKVDDEKWWNPPRLGPRTWVFFGGRSFILVRWWCWWWDFGPLCLVMRNKIKLNHLIHGPVMFQKNFPGALVVGVTSVPFNLINMKASWRLCKIYLIDDHEQRNSAGRFYLKMPWFSHTYHTHPYAASGQRDVRFLTDFPFLMEG